MSTDTNIPTPRTDAEACEFPPTEFSEGVDEWVAAKFARTLERELAQANRKLERELEHSRKRVEAYKSALAAARKDSERLRGAIAGAIRIKSLWMPTVGESMENEEEARDLVSMYAKLRATMEGGER